MVRQTNPRKKTENQKREGEEIPLKAKRKLNKEKYRHQNNWLEDEDEDFDIEKEIFGVEDDFHFDDELDADFIEDYNKDYGNDSSDFSTHDPEDEDDFDD